MAHLSEQQQAFIDAYVANGGDGSKALLQPDIPHIRRGRSLHNCCASRTCWQPFNRSSAAWWAVAYAARRCACSSRS